MLVVGAELVRPVECEAAPDQVAVHHLHVGLGEGRPAGPHQLQHRLQVPVVRADRGADHLQETLPRWSPSPRPAHLDAGGVAGQQVGGEQLGGHVVGELGGRLLGPHRRLSGGAVRGHRGALADRVVTPGQINISTLSDLSI